jgi:hypothetical protein
MLYSGAKMLIRKSKLSNGDTESRRGESPALT